MLRKCTTIHLSLFSLHFFSKKFCGTNDECIILRLHRCVYVDKSGVYYFNNGDAHKWMIGWRNSFLWSNAHEWKNKKKKKHTNYNYEHEHVWVVVAVVVIELRGIGLHWILNWIVQQRCDGTHISLFLFVVISLRGWGDTMSAFFPFYPLPECWRCASFFFSLCFINFFI